MQHWLTWFFKSLWYLIIDIPVELFGLIAVAIGLPFRRSYPETAVEFTQFPNPQNKWMLVRLPSWLKWWDNKYDGLMGDRRGYWDSKCIEKHGKNSSDPLMMYLWAALRNPANEWSRSVISIGIGGCKVTKLAGNADDVTEDPGKKEWMFLLCETADGRKFYRLFVSFAWASDPNHAWQIDWGWKFRLDHNGMATDAPEKDRLRSSVHTITPWKKL